MYTSEKQTVYLLAMLLKGWYWYPFADSCLPLNCLPCSNPRIAKRSPGVIQCDESVTSEAFLIETLHVVYRLDDNILTEIQDAWLQ